jgi:hypothetical protein
LSIPHQAKTLLLRPHYGVLFTLILAVLFFGTSTQAAVGKNKLTIVNQSGEDTAIKVIGPREWLIEIPAGQERTILLPSGDYTYLTRYGQDPNFRYSRGTPFQIEQSRIGFTEASLTLISAPSSTYVDPALLEQFNRPVAPAPESPADKKPLPDRKIPLEEKAPLTPASPKDKPKGDFILHRVAGGETLPTISQYYSGDADYWPEIAKYNSSLDPLRLKPGTTVKIPIYLAILHKTPPEARPSDPSPTAPKKKSPKPLSPPPALPKPPEGGFGPK